MRSFIKNILIGFIFFVCLGNLFALHGKIVFYDGTYVLGKVVKVDESSVYIIPVEESIAVPPWYIFCLTSLPHPSKYSSRLSFIVILIQVEMLDVCSACSGTEPQQHQKQ